MSYWHGTRACVIGGAGMIGHQLVRLLLAEGAGVTVIDDNSRGKNYIPGAAYIHADAADSASISSAFYRFIPSHVFNLAAYVAGVEYNVSHQYEMFSKNVGILLAPIRACLNMEKRPRFLQTSSVCVYGPDANSPAYECNIGGEPTDANVGYSHAKRMGEIAARLAVAEGLDTVIVRPTNAYGPADYFDSRAHVIPALIKKALSASDVLQVNSSSPIVREFIYSEDVAKGMMAAMERGKPGEAYNLGYSMGIISMYGLAHKILEACEVDKPVVFANDIPGVDKQRHTSADLASEVLRWEATTNLSDGLAKTVAWYRKNLL